MENKTEMICGVVMDNQKPCPRLIENCHYHDDDTRKAGRPSDFWDEWRREAIIETAQKPLPLKIVAMAGAITRETLNNWLDKKDKTPQHSEFFVDFCRARVEAAKECGEMALLEGDAMKLLKISFGIEDKQKIKKEISGPDGEPIQTEEVSDEDAKELQDYTEAFRGRFTSDN